MRLSFWLASCIGAALSCGFLAHESCSYSLGIGMGAIAIFLLDLPGFNGTVSYSCRFLLRALHRPFGMPLAMVSRLLTYGKHYLPLRQIFTPSVTLSPSALASFPCRFLLILITSITQVLHRLICGCTDALVHVIRILGFFILICTAVDSHEVITPRDWANIQVLPYLCMCRAVLPKAHGYSDFNWAYIEARERAILYIGISCPHRIYDEVIKGSSTSS